MSLSLLPPLVDRKRAIPKETDISALIRNENQEVYMSDLDIDNATTHTALLYKASISGATEGRAYRFQLGNASAYLHFKAEL